MNKFSTSLEELLIEPKEFEKNLTELNNRYVNIITKIQSTLNLNLPKSELETLLNDENYLTFIYLYKK